MIPQRIVIRQIDVCAAETFFRDTPFAENLPELLGCGLVIAKTYYIMSVIGETIEIATDIIRRQKTDFDSIVGLLVNILFQRQNTTFGVRLQTPTHTTITAISTHQPFTGDLFPGLQSDDNLAVSLLKTLESPLKEGATCRDILLQELVIKHFTLYNPDRLIHVKLTLSLPAYIDANTINRIEIISDTWQQMIKQMPSLRRQSAATDLVSWECGMINQQTVHACLLQQIATHGTSWSRSNNQDICMFHFGFLSTHSI